MDDDQENNDNPASSSLTDRLTSFVDSPLFILYVVSLALGILLKKFINRMATPRLTKTTVEGLRTLIRDTIPTTPGSKSKKKQTKEDKPNLLFINRDFSHACPVNRYDEVYPGIFVGDQHLAFQKHEMAQLGITHVLNAAQGQKFAQIDTTAAYYADLDIKFLGIKAMDSANCKLCVHFPEAAEFIYNALWSGGKVFVHCFQGISRSATLVLVYLMMHRNMSVEQAIKKVRSKRPVFPNDGFLKQLVDLNEQLARERADRPAKGSTEGSTEVDAARECTDQPAKDEGHVRTEGDGAKSLEETGDRTESGMKVGKEEDAVSS